MIASFREPDHCLLIIAWDGRANPMARSTVIPQPYLALSIHPSFCARHKWRMLAGHGNCISAANFRAHCWVLMFARPSANDHHRACMWGKWGKTVAQRILHNGAHALWAPDKIICTQKDWGEKKIYTAWGIVCVRMRSADFQIWMVRTVCCRWFLL